MKMRNVHIEYSYNEPLTILDRFLCIRIVDSNVESSITTSTGHNEQISLHQNYEQ